LCNWTGSGSHRHGIFGAAGGKGIDKGDFQSAYDLASKAIKLSPDDSLAYETRAAAAYEMGRYAEAEADLTKILELEPDRMEVLLWRGHVYYEWNRLQLALDDYNAVFEHDPKDEDAAYYRMLTALQMDDGDKVLEYAAETLRINPRNADAEAFMGMVYIYDGDLDSALEHFNRAIQYDIGLSELYYLRAEIYFEKGDWLNMRSDLQTFMSIDAQDARAAEIRILLDWLDDKIAGKDVPMPEFPDLDS
jgi:tetratricopeptide (TPR) repeat protein